MGFFGPDEGDEDRSSFLNPGGMRPADWREDRYGRGYDRGYGRDRGRRHYRDDYDYYGYDRDDPWSGPGFMHGDVDDSWLDNADRRSQDRRRRSREDREERRRDARERARDRVREHEEDERMARKERNRAIMENKGNVYDRYSSGLDAKFGNASTAKVRSKSRIRSLFGNSGTDDEDDKEEGEQKEPERITYGGYERPEASIMELIDENMNVVLIAVIIITGLLVLMLKMA